MTRIAAVKLLVFAHKPPPHHGQSYMVQLLLGAMGGDRRTGGHDGDRNVAAAVECYHVDCRFSDGIEDIGRIRLSKLFLALKYCFEAIGCRWRFGVHTLLYVPAPPLRSAIYRDWLLMLICRPFFRTRILYWQAAGLGEWLTTRANWWERGVTRWLLGRPDLSIVLGEFCRGDAAAFASKRVEVVPNAVPDPCPNFATTLLEHRRARAKERLERIADVGTKGQNTSRLLFRVLFMSLCTREKGLFDTVDAVAMANQRLAAHDSPVRIQLEVAGKFWRDEERVEFEQRIRQADVLENETPLVRYHGFVNGADKHRLMTESDCLCFPTYYQAESFGIVLVEAMAFGLSIVTSNWRTIPELLPPAYGGVVAPRAPEQIAAALLALLKSDYDPRLRERFLDRYTDRQFAKDMSRVLNSLG